MKILWLDMEMTGLDPERDRVLEIATVVSSLGIHPEQDLVQIAQGPELVVRQPASVLVAMDPWCVATHGASGLTQRCLESAVSLDDADVLTAAFVRQHFPHGGAILAGNSIHQDRRFIRRHLPHLESLLHYRMIDVTSVRLLVDAWRPDVEPYRRNRPVTHRAAEDVQESIAELRALRAALGV